MTDQFAVVGSPISHSKSPLIHQACFEFLAKDASYNAHDVTDLAAFLSEHVSLRGLSVTMPLKTQAYQLAEDHDVTAIRTQNCNTLFRTQSGWSGFNTDVFGLQQAAGSHAAGTVSILGTGASARSALVAFESSRTAIWGRNPAKSSDLATEFGVENVALERALSADLVVSTLPGAVLEDLVPVDKVFSGTLLDISYVNADSSNLEFAGGRIPGIEMLIWQALMQQRIFAGNEPQQPLEHESKMLEVVRSALNMAK